MKELELAEKILSDIVDNDVEFSEALRKVFQADASVRELRPTVSGLVGCELRHHLLFSYLTEKLEGYTPSEKRFLSICLANLYFFKRIPFEEIDKAMDERLGAAKKESAKPLIDKKDSPTEFIPSDISKTGSRYLSLRYNTPEWVLKIWQHFGYGATYKILKKNSKSLTSSYRVRTSLLNEEALLNNNPDFVKSPVEGILFYGGKKPVRKMQEYIDGTIFQEKCATKKVLDKYKVQEPSEVMAYIGGKDESVAKEILETYGSSIGINIGVPNADSHLSILKMIKKDGLKNVNFYAAEDPLSMDVAISRPQDLVIAAPNSSNFDLIREQPDYLLHFKKEGMDALFKQEKDVLEGCSKHVAEDGILIYMIHTISKKEGTSTIEAFLANHHEFQIVEQEQLMPFDELDTAMYYCVLKKNTKLAKLSAPVGALPASAMENEVSSMAMPK